MPSGWLYEYAAMYVKLQDEEMLREIASVSAGTGAMARTERFDLVRSLQRGAGLIPRKAPPIFDFASIGITLIEEPADG